MDDLEVLKNIFIFRGLDETRLAEVNQTLLTEKVVKGEYVFWEGDLPESLHILKSGKLKLIKQSENGKETILGIVSPGETFGEIALFDGRPLSFSAQTMEKSVVLKMRRPEFLQYLYANKIACLEIIIEFARRLRDAQDVIKGMAADKVEHRILELLLKLAEKVGRREQEGTRIGILLTRQDIADMVGSTVETTIRILSRLTKKGLITSRSKSIIIRDLDALREAIEEEALS